MRLIPSAAHAGISPNDDCQRFSTRSSVGLPSKGALGEIHGFESLGSERLNPSKRVAWRSIEGGCPQRLLAMLTPGWRPAEFGLPALLEGKLPKERAASLRRRLQFNTQNQKLMKAIIPSNGSSARRCLFQPQSCCGFQAWMEGCNAFGNTRDRRVVISCCRWLRQFMASLCGRSTNLPGRVTRLIVRSGTGGGSP